MGMGRIAVIGATGFIGARLVEKLVLEHGAQVTAVVRNPSRGARLAQLDVKMKKANLDRAHEIENAIAGQDIVFNLAYDFTKSGDENFKGFINLADACARHKVQCLVHVSSIVVYDDWPAGDLSETSPAHKPGTDYKNAKMKMEAELSRRAQDGSLPSVILQPTIVYGPFSWLWTDHIVERLASGTVVLPDDGQGLCPAVYVDDVADAMIAAATGTHRAGDRFIVSGPRPVTWRAFFEAYAHVLGRDSIRYVDAAQLAQGRSSPAAKLKGLLGNPLQIANWRPVRRLLNTVRERMGDGAIEKLRSIAMTMRQRRGPIVYYPSESELALYLSKGRCRIEKASERLGYTPAFDFAAGAKLTADYIRCKFPEAVAKDGKT